MPTLKRMLEELRPEAIAEAVGQAHDAARSGYRLDSNVVSDFREFEDEIETYYRHHYRMAVDGGADLGRVECLGRAKELIDKTYRRKGRNLMAAYRNASAGLDGGLRGVLDLIADGLKEESVERRVRDVLDRYMSPDDPDEKIDVVAQILEEFHHLLPDHIDRTRPELLISETDALVRELVEAFKRASDVLRRF